MTVYREMYYKLAFAAAKAIDLLRVAMQECDELYEASVERKVAADEDEKPMG